MALRLAFVSPLPPAPTGIAEYSADLLGLLAPDHDIDVFHGQDTVDRDRLPVGCGLHPASALPGLQRAQAYDLVVYQMGNGPAHAFLYELLSRVPGLLVLHDFVLHHSRAAHFLEAEEVRAWRRDPGDTAAREAARPCLDRWREELAYTYPGWGERLFEAHLGTVGDLLPYAWPLARLPIETSRAVVVHNSWMAWAVEEEVPGTTVVQVPMPTTAEGVGRQEVAALRRRLGFDEDDVVIGTFGLLTPEKQVKTVARAVARVAADEPRVRLLLAGPVPEGARLEEALEGAGVAARTVVTGRLPLEEIPVHIEAADAVVQLRYPTARETSAALLRVLAQGRPTVISDLGHQSEIPRDAVVRADVADEEGAVSRALLELIRNPARARSVGEAAATWVAREHSPEVTRAAWADALEQGRRQPTPAARKGWPAHWPRP